jgi:hypothetical protein
MPKPKPKPKPFSRYTRQEAAAIRRTLTAEKVRLKKDEKWEDVLAVLTSNMREVTSDTSWLHEASWHRKKLMQGFMALAAAFAAAAKASRALEPLQRTALSSQLVRIMRSREDDPKDNDQKWNAPLWVALSPEALEGMREDILEAANQVTTDPPPYLFVSKTRSKDQYMQRAIYALLVIFEQATGLPARAYFSDHHDAGYGGNFYPFAIAALTPVFPGKKPETLSSAIHAFCKAWHPAKKKR